MNFGHTPLGVTACRMTSASAAARGSVNTSSSSSAGRRDRPAGPASSGTRRWCPADSGCAVADRVGQRQRQQPRRGPAQVCGAGPARPAPIVGSGPSASSPTRRSSASHAGLLGAVGGEFLVDGPGQQAQLVAQPHMLAGQVAGRRRQVVRGDRRQAVLPPPLGGQRPAVAVAVQLEPQDRRAEQAACAQVVAHPRLDGAEILTDDDARRRDAPPARRCRSSPRGRSARRCPRSGGAPSGIHHSRNSPMMWSIRTPPACRSTALIRARNGS